VTAEEFTNRFVQAMRQGKLPSFRKHFRECDALLVDDINFLATKTATQEEFLHTLDELHGQGKQVVVSCDCHPRLEDDFAPELRDRLLGGSVWALMPPDQKTRLEILRRRAARANPPLSEEVLVYISEQIKGNVRELEGAFHCAQHYGRVLGKPVDVAMARIALADLIRHTVRILQIDDVENAVCKVLRLDSGALKAKQRTWTVSHPRMLAIFLARKYTSAAYSEIGRHFGGRTHSTAVIAEKKVRQWLTNNGNLVLGEQRLPVREIIEQVEKELRR
jgi:chromosomal replication initiator protein